MPGYRVIALDLETARKVRESRRSPGYGHVLSRHDVDYLHVRDTEAGCYDFRIERTS